MRALSSDDDAVTGEETENEEAESNIDTDQAHGDEEIPPRLTSTPVSDSAAIFKIVDIENRGNGIFPIPGDDNSAHPAMQSGDADSAKVSDENSARALSRSASDAGSTTHTGNPPESGSGSPAPPQLATDSGSSNPKMNSKKVPAMVKPPKIAAPPGFPQKRTQLPALPISPFLLQKKGLPPHHPRHRLPQCELRVRFFLQQGG